MEARRLKRVNQSLASVHTDARIAHILNKYGNRALVTTSFGTTSVLLLHMISRIKHDFPIHFVDTGYLFPETLEYRDELIRRFDLNVITHKPNPTIHKETKEIRLWESNPDLCCAKNKIDPVQNILKEENFEVWISGLLGFQNDYRTGLEILQKKKGLFRFYPLIDWSKQLVNEYIEYHGLPRHPLERIGYSSVGCTHCTVQGKGRDGRWNGSGKSECGLHT
jgi:phosphoadenosine phosphosulfate reductase